MAVILGIEGSTQATSVALWDGEGLFAEYTLALGLTQGEQLLPAIDRLLQAARTTAVRLSAIAVAVGPGSFTGVRIAVTTAKGLARAVHIPVVAVSSLAGLAQRFLFFPYPICPLIDARKDEVYAALFRNKSGRIERMMEDRVLRPQKLVELIKEPCLFVGNGALRYQPYIESRIPKYANFASGSLNIMSAASIAEIGVGKWKAGRCLDPSELVPNYVRRSEAEIRRQGPP
ncbi:MAG: tRNA (adenosine(37)-N6)-threonylcarbamoyltransferase complex dimerization subunit type 1 TsaB [bacterium]|nr:tRNA (adenosine(37)-N6)-threonylcarbamoyltransferase complex dimerization subunit type 1 TsaB [bacterium]